MPERLANRHGTGWTLVEFVIALTLSMLLTLLASGLLLAAASSYRHHNDQQDLNDAGRQALTLLAQAIRQAAYVEWDSAAAPVGLAEDLPAAIAGLDGRSLSRSSEGISAALPAVAHGSDVLALRFAGSGPGPGSGSGSAASGDGSSVNCAGFAVATPAAAEAQGWSIFYVAADAGGEPELRCKYRSASGWGSDALLRGVESFQVLYGVDTDTPADGLPNSYLNATAINALDAGLALVGATVAERQRDLNRKTYWKRVGSIELALLLRADAATRADTGSRQFVLFGAAYADAHAEDDGTRIDEARLPEAQRRRVRVLVGSTIALRNGRS